MSYRVYVPSRGRARRDLQYTLSMFSHEVLQKTYLVVRADEYQDYIETASKFPGLQLIQRPDTCTNLSQTLEWIIHEHAEPEHTAIMLDDDLRFSIRIDREDMRESSLRMADQEDVEEILEALDDLISDEVAMSGVSARFGNNNLTQEINYCGRQMQVHAVDVNFFREKDIRPSKVICKSDFFMTLSVLTNGRENAVIGWATVDQAKGSNSEGGVSVYRNFEVLNEGAERLRAFFPDYVTVVEKTTKWKGIDRPFNDVRVAWKKAYAGTPKPKTPSAPKPPKVVAEPTPFKVVHRAPKV